MTEIGDEVIEQSGSQLESDEEGGRRGAEAGGDGEFVRVEYVKGRRRTGGVRASFAKQRATASEDCFTFFTTGALDRVLAVAEEQVLEKLGECYAARLEEVGMTDPNKRRSIRSTMLDLVKGRLEELGWRSSLRLPRHRLREQLGEKYRLGIRDLQTLLQVVLVG